MLIEQLDSLFTYWRSAPPVHEMVAAYMGVKPELSETVQPTISDSERATVEAMRLRMDARG